MSVHTEERRIFSEFLKRKGLKTTRERTALFDEIFSTHRHFDAEDLVLRMRERGVKISRATVYRSLDLLFECGLVGRVRLNEEKYRYERLRKAGRGLLAARLSSDLALASDPGPLRFVPPARREGGGPPRRVVRNGVSSAVCRLSSPSRGGAPGEGRER